MIPRSWVPWILVALLLVAGLPLSHCQGVSRGLARGQAEALRRDRIQAGRVADSLYQKHQESVARSDSLVRVLESRQASQERQRRALAVRADSVAGRAVDLGETVRDAILSLPLSEPRDTALGRLDRHLAEDAHAVLAYRAALEAAEAQIETLTLIGATWEDRARGAELALDASRVEARLAREEATKWRGLASPGLFTRIRQALPLISGGAVLGAGLVLLVL